MLIWHRQLWLIDHGASLYFHYDPKNPAERSRDPFPMIKEHVLLKSASRLREIDATLSGRLTSEVIEEIVQRIPDLWLDDAASGGIDRRRRDYREYLLDRLKPPRPFLEEAIHAKSRDL